jgi:putative hydrolase of the HAD superfamily
MTTLVLWDFAGVLCRFQPDRRVQEIARRSRRSPDDVRTLLTPELHAALNVGAMSAGELQDLISTHLEWHCTAEELAQAWSAAFVVDPMVVTLARRTTVAKALLTNNGPPLSDAYAALYPEVAAVVPVTFFSGHTGIAKPDADAFLGACAAMGVAVAEALMIDDSQANIEAASDAGLETHHYRRPPALSIDLQQRGVLAAS